MDVATEMSRADFWSPFGSFVMSTAAITIGKRK